MADAPFVPDPIVLYVHGTGDRDTLGVSNHIALLKAGFNRNGRQFRIEDSSWGKEFGTALVNMRDVIPPPHEGAARTPPLGLDFEALRAFAGNEVSLIAAIARDFKEHRQVLSDQDSREVTDALLFARRDTMSNPAMLGFTDIIWYMKHGDKLRDSLRSRLRSLIEEAHKDQKVITLGNSLGGIVLLETLCEYPDPPLCDLLITTGSQPGALKIFEALIEPALSTPSIPWLNIYDRRDFMGFLAGPAWNNPRGIVDVEVNLQIGFPHSHGAGYFKDPTTYSPSTFEIMLHYIERAPKNTGRQVIRDSNSDWIAQPGPWGHTTNGEDAE